MTIISSISKLTIKRAINLYTIVLFLSFGILLYWFATDRYQVFINHHKITADNTTKIVAFEINKTLNEKKRIIDIFIEQHKDLIANLSNNPEDEETHQAIEQLLRQFQPDFFAFNILSLTGEPIIGNFDGNLGEICLQDLQHYIKNGTQNIRVHPNYNSYHYDIISDYSFGTNQLLFFVSFNIDKLSDLLASTQPDKHSLILIHKKSNNLIEITAQGSRQDIDGRLDFRMNGDERLRVLSTAKVKGTSWHVIDMRGEGLYDRYRKSILIDYVLAFFVFSAITLFMRNILINLDVKRTAAEKQLQKNHQQIKDLNNQLERLSKTDSLTDLYNRRYFDERINIEWYRGLRSNHKLSCILLDVDYFKNYNDYYGHQAGDDCLKAISKLMKETFRRAGDIAARYGGEEFIVIMSECSEEETQAAVTQFQQALERLKILHRKSSVNDYVTVSAGIINQIPTNDESVEDFIRKADKALYRAKAGGRNQWVTHRH